MKTRRKASLRSKGAHLVTTSIRLVEDFSRSSPRHVLSVRAAPVAQTCSLLYRRFLTCHVPLARNLLPIANRRYGRLKICATVNRYSPRGEEEASIIECPSPQPSLHSFLAGRVREFLVVVSRCARPIERSKLSPKFFPSTPKRISGVALCARFYAALVTFTMCCAFAGEAAIGGPSAELPHAVRYELGDAAFAPGDNITIQQVRGSSDTIATGGTYSVEGTYTLSSRDEADLAFFTTTLSDNGPTPIDPRQLVRIKKGTGSFHLVKTLSADGYLHVSFYPGPSGSDFGGVYFGQGNRVLRGKGVPHLDHPGNDRSPPIALSGPNQVLLEYLGNPVEPPANLDARYAKEGLINAIQLAARKSRVALKKLAIEDSEYPFLIGVICRESDFPKLKDQIKKMDGYAYNGGTGSPTCNAFNIVPYEVYPPEASQRIHHRLMLRQQVFYDKLSAQQ